MISTDVQALTLENVNRLENVDFTPLHTSASEAFAINNSRSLSTLSISSNLSKTYSIGSGISIFDKLGLRKKTSDSIESSHSDINSNPKELVIKILKSIKEMNKINSSKMSLISFFEMIQTHYYKDISLSLLKQFLLQHKTSPKPIYFHYYIYFLHYAEYYHYTRSTTDIIDKYKILFHKDCLSSIKLQLKYVYRIVNHNNNITNTEITL